MKTAQTLIVQQVPIAQIRPSPTNPRKHYDPAALEELAASIRSVGVQVPLSLRIAANGDRRDTVAHLYEIVGGERRWRAAQIAGLSSIPAIARMMTDAECREAQLVDNLQRADLTPMEEAECYQALRADDLPVEVLAAKVGKTVQYVTQRLRLLQLIPEAREALRAGVINLTLALLIARLAPVKQVKAATYAVNPQRFLKGTLAEMVAAAKAGIDADDQRYWRCARESEMRDWIADNTLLPLKGVAWRLDDPDLIPNAGPCTECPKRAGNAAMLFGDLAADGDTCTDPECYERKRKATVKEALKRETNAIRLLDAESYAPVKVGATALKRGQWLEAKAGSCANVTAGVTEDGRRLDICPEQKCKTHKHRVDKPMERGQSAHDWEAERQQREEKKRAYAEAEQPIRLAIWAAIQPKLKGATLLRVVLDDLADAGPRASLVAGLRGIAHEEFEATGPVRKALAKAKDSELEGWLAEFAAAEALAIGAHNFAAVKEDREDLWALGKRVGVDCDAIASKAAKAQQGATSPEAAGSAKKTTRKPAKKTAKRKAARK